MKTPILILITAISLSSVAIPQDKSVKETTVKKETLPPPRIQSLQNQNLDGIERKKRRGFFTQEDSKMVIPGFGRRAVWLLVLKQLELTPEQKQNMIALSSRTGRKLVTLRQDLRALNDQLEDAIYGENFETTRVNQLAALAGDKSAELIKFQASIEAEFRTILTPDQFQLYLQLISDILPQYPQLLKRLQNRP